MTFKSLNDEVSEEELARIIAETMWMADRPRTWWEWLCWQFSFLRKDKW